MMAVYHVMLLRVYRPMLFFFLGGGGGGGGRRWSEMLKFSLSLSLSLYE